ncbi:unnamed protein product [Natator depressus]
MLLMLLHGVSLGEPGREQEMIKGTEPFCAGFTSHGTWVSWGLESYMLRDRSSSSQRPVHRAHGKLPGIRAGMGQLHFQRKETVQRESGAAPRMNGPDWQCIKLPLSLHLAFCISFIN